MQILSIYIGTYGFEYISGLNLGLTVDLSDQLLIGVDFHLSTLSYKLGLEPEKYFFRFNLVAIAIIYYIEKNRSNIKKVA